jgi:cytochrome c553
LKHLFASMLPIVAMLCAGTPVAGQQVPPAWAYPVNPPDFKLPADDGALRKVPNSAVTMTLSQVRDRFYAPDWHPDDHPALPEAVARGRKPEVFACGFCHRADGAGGPENANLMGLPAAYIMQQIADFKSGERKSAVMNRAPMSFKETLAKAVTDQETALAAAYFASIKPRANIRVVESETAPKTVVAAWFLMAAESGEIEPIGERIIELADDVERFTSRDARVTFTAYVPPTSIQKGRDLAAGKDSAAPCGSCHGENLKGAGDIPGIAGKSPTYIFRQLYDYKHGVRAGRQSAAMTPSVAKLTISDMIALAAYAASLAP